ncbi:MAG: carboxypeptidase regulatory-like domain-containing protein [Deltaproteobacteria bacterium]|nr:carboxypeptidase regulatory-like domain-containing protein [Deltaproteobacteria bacterium]
MSQRSSLLVAAAIVVAAAACDRPKKRPLVTKGHATTSVCAQNPALPAPAPPAPSSIPPVPATAAAQPDVALFAAAGLGLVALGDSGFAPPRPSKSGLLVPDGDALWIVGRNGVDHLHDGKVDQVAGESDLGLVAAAAVAPDHTLWVAEYDAVRHYDGAAWSKEDKEVVGSKDTSLADLVVDDDGRVWVVSPVGVFVRGAAGWQRFGECDDTRQNESLGALGKVPGAVLLATSGGVYRITSKEVTRTGYDDGTHGSPRSVTQASDGTLWLADEDTAEEIKPDGSVRSLRAGFFGLDYINRIVPDGRGRVWILGGGFAVVDAGGVTSWPTSSLAELGAGTFDMMILGNGPAKLPPPGKGKLTTSVTGHVTAGGKPAKGVKVILCSSPRMSFRGNPCDGQSPKKATTKADGTWRIDGVPLGSYGLAYFRGGWTITDGDSVMATSPSNPVDMGGITYD